MTGNNDELLKDFFGEHKQEIPDKGFSRRVMRNLPDRSLKLSRRWAMACQALAITLFFALGGVQAVKNALYETFISMMQSGANSLDLRSLLIAATVLLFFGIRSIITAD